MPLTEVGQTYSHKCSLCGRRILATNKGLSEFPYCHCGADMRGEWTDLVKGVPSVTPTQKTKAEIIDDLIKEIKDAEKKFDDIGSHGISAGFYYARKELEKMKGAE